MKGIVIPLLCLGMLLGHALAFIEQNSAELKVVEKVYGLQARLRVTEWRELVNHLLEEPRPEKQRLAAVNSFFNQLHFVEDKKIWGQEDYWATPVEFIGAKGGDCEDFSLAKYFTLREIGIPDEKIRLVYAKAIALNQFHMVLAYYPEIHATPIILDNLDPELKLANQRPDLIPVYSFNAEHLWIMKERVRGELAGGSSRLSKWTQMRHRYSSGELKQPIIDLNY